MDANGNKLLKGKKMFKKSTEKIQLQLSELDKRSEYQALVIYVHNKDEPLSGRLTVLCFQKAILSKWLLQKIEDNKLSIITITEALDLAYNANMYLEKIKGSIGNRFPTVHEVMALSSYSAKLDAALSQRLVARKKDEFKSDSAPLEVTKSSLITKSDLSRIIVNLLKLLKTAEINLDNNVELTTLGPR